MSVESSAEGGAVAPPSARSSVNAVPARQRPTRPSAALATVAVAGGVLLVAGPGAPAVGLVLVGLATIAVGDELRDRNRRASAVAALGLGAVVGLVGVAAGAVLAGDIAGTLRAVPGLLGVFFVGVGVVPLRGDGSRGLVKFGVGLVLVTVLLAGIFRAVPPSTLVASAAVAVVGWDLGEHAINVGEQLGRGASTWRGEAVHAVGAGVVGGAAVVTTHFADGVGSAGLSLPALALLVLAVVLFSVALHE